MRTLYLNYNTKINKINIDDNVKTLNKRIILLEDLEIIENNYKKYDLIILKNDKLKQRQDFDIEDFYKNFVHKNNNIKLFILSSYNEKCKDLKKIDDYGDYNFFKSIMPGEIEAFAIKSKDWPEIKILLDKSKEEKINSKIKNLVFNEELNTVFSWPQVYYFSDKFNLLEICRQEKDSFITPRIKEFSFYWFFVTFFFSIIFTYLIYDKIPKDRFFYLANK
jgi:hypothetical protein